MPCFVGWKHALKSILVIVRSPYRLLITIPDVFTNRPTLLELWNDTTVLKLTPRLCLSMESGMGDYDDGGLLRWTIANPTKDFLPYQFITRFVIPHPHMHTRAHMRCHHPAQTLSYSYSIVTLDGLLCGSIIPLPWLPRCVCSVEKTFAFPPGTSKRYSSIGYVLVGMVLSAVTNKTTWAGLDQSALLALQTRPVNHNYFLFFHHGAKIRDLICVLRPSTKGAA